MTCSAAHSHVDLSLLKLLNSTGDLAEYRAKLQGDKNPDRKIVSVCTGTGCKSALKTGSALASFVSILVKFTKSRALSLYSPKAVKRSSIISP